MPDTLFRHDGIMPPGLSLGAAVVGHGVPDLLGYAARIHTGGEHHARLRAFPPQAVFGPCFSTGSRLPISGCCLSLQSCHARLRASCSAEPQQEGRKRP